MAKIKCKKQTKKKTGKKEKKRGKKRERKRKPFLKVSQLCDNFPEVTLKLLGESVHHSPKLKTLIVNLVKEIF